MALTDGLQLLHKFDSSNVDDSDNSNNATIIGATYDTSVKAHGSASLNFDGINDYATVAHHSSLNFGTGDFTIACKLYPKSTPSVEWRFINKGAGGAIPQFRVNLNTDNTITLLVYDGSTLQSVTSTGTVPNGSFASVICIRRSTGLYIYIEDSLEGTLLASAINVSNSSVLYYGVWSTLVDFNDIKLDEVAMWNRDLTSDERTEYHSFGVRLGVGELINGGLVNNSLTGGRLI